jgi:hypothetical protein
MSDNQIEVNQKVVVTDRHAYIALREYCIRSETNFDKQFYYELFGSNSRDEKLYLNAPAIVIGTVDCFFLVLQNNRVYVVTRTGLKIILK